MAHFSKILIANRGEIAVRVCRTAKALGYRTVAVFSEADANALHVQVADEAVCIGPPAVRSSYLNIENILAAAEKTGADAIHPGYGFLSENAYFSKACADSGLTFIGPDYQSILMMGNKRAAKERMIAAGVPCVPGYQEKDQRHERLLEEAIKTGFPLMIKAAAGGGGRGMRLVFDEKDLNDALLSAKSEALSAFGSDEIILEKAIMRPRHIEIQVFGDRHGNVVYLGERDCSIQRRHQKVVEEAPSPFVDPELRRKMGEAGVAAAKEVNYVGAGTVEFLVDEDKSFYFLEMNTRLQVEHPVTEMITGMDLVALQIKVAEGKPLGFTQEQVTLTGHAIEVRLYAEDPATGFLPQTGKVLAWHPTSNPGIRVDNGLAQDQEISSHYDPMVSKIISYGSDRLEAIRKLIKGLDDCVFLGLKHNKGFLMELLGHEEFVQGKATTAMIGTHFPNEVLSKSRLTDQGFAIASALFYQQSAEASQPMNSLQYWKNSNPGTQIYKIRADDTKDQQTSLKVKEPGLFDVMVNRKAFELRIISIKDAKLRVMCNSIIRSYSCVVNDDGVWMEMEGIMVRFENLTHAPPQSSSAAGEGKMLSVMNGRIVAIRVKEGQSVTVGQTLVVLEAMKMEHQVKSDVAGTVKTILVHQDQQVKARQLLVEVEPSNPETKS
ncbi:MAG: acetyl/propionyl/methylcrotonyl-CoA carboxylase subunit alpha [SAR324 cluster bacterium]|nr:acetyl/propionyl/methylcrotonyl-CoA carboxylase subunit alpha [SAR324 cluster bacterium]